MLQFRYTVTHVVASVTLPTYGFGHSDFTIMNDMISDKSETRCVSVKLTLPFGGLA